MVRRAEDLTVILMWHMANACTYSMCSTVNTRAALHAVLELSTITYNWWRSAQLPAAHKALRPCPLDHPSTHPSCHPSIFTEGLSNHEDWRSANYAGSGAAQPPKWCLVQTSITNVFSRYWLVATLWFNNLLSGWFVENAMILVWSCPEQQCWV